MLSRPFYASKKRSKVGFGGIGALFFANDDDELPPFI